jgi:predicted DNA-binding transcriptional regulator YafY
MRSLPPPLTAARLAQETGVSERTLYRDIESLRAAGALIDGEAGYGYRLTEDPALPPQSFNRLELEALVVGLSEVMTNGDTALGEAARGALAKITARLPDRQAQQAIHAVSRVFRHEAEAVPAHVGPLRQASWEERAVDIAYCDADGQETERRIWPLSVVYFDDRQMILAWCCLRQDFRKFLLSRIAGVTLTEESFRPRRVPLLRTFMAKLRKTG